MGGWIIFWKILLICCFIAYVILAVAVGIGGFSNLKDFIKDLSAPDQE